MPYENNLPIFVCRVLKGSVKAKYTVQIRILIRIANNNLILGIK